MRPYLDKIGKEEFKERAREVFLQLIFQITNELYKKELKYNEGSSLKNIGVRLKNDKTSKKMQEFVKDYMDKLMKKMKIN